MSRETDPPDTNDPEKIFEEGAQLMEEIGLFSVPLSQSNLKPSDMIKRLDIFAEKLKKLAEKP